MKLHLEILSIFFSDGHARSMTTTYYTQPIDFAKLDWEAISATNWGSNNQDLRRKEKKQAEFLVKRFVPLEAIQFFGVFNSWAAEKAQKMLEKHNLQTEIKISPSKLYYDHL